MRRILLAAVVCAAVAALAGADEAKKWVCIDLQPQANTKLKDNVGGDDNHLAELGVGEKTLEGVKFAVGDGYILLGSHQNEDKPARVDGIKVDRKLARLHVLHAIGGHRRRRRGRLH